MPAPFYSSETPSSCIHIIKDFIVPGLLGRELNKIDDINDIFKNIRGNNFAKAGIEIALWDLFAKHEEKPLYEYIGGKNKEIPWKISIGIKPSISKLLDTIEHFLEKGLQHIKIKIKKGWDIEPVKRIRERFGKISLSVDANSFYTLQDMDTFRELDNYSLVQIEQPLNYDDIYDHHILRNSIKTPVCMDESIKGMVTAKNTLDLGSCDIVNIKIQRVGGLRNAISIHDMCKARGIPVWIGCMPDSGVGHAAGLAMCSLPNVLYPSDIPPGDAYFKEDIVVPEIKMNKDGNIGLFSGPGLGVTLKDDMVDKFKVTGLEYK